MSSVATESVRSTPAPASGDELALFHRTLAQLCRSELPLPRAFELLERDLRKGGLKDAVGAMARSIEDGATLDEAYASQEGNFPPLYRALVEAGLRTGDLPAALDEIASHAARRAEIDARLRAALAYPTISASVVVVVAVLLFIFVAPGFEAVAVSVDGMSMFTSGTLQAGFGGRWFAAALAVGALVLIAGFFWLTLRFTGPLERSRLAARVRFRMPLIGRLRLDASLATLAGTLALLVRRQVPLAQALDLTSHATEDPVLRERVNAMANAADDGRSISDAIGIGDVFAPSLLWLLDAAEKRGEAGDALADIAAIYHARLDRAIDRTTLLVTPVFEIVVGIVGCILALSFMVPLFEIAAAVMDLTRKLL